MNQIKSQIEVNEKKQKLIDHLTELRDRLVYSFIFFFIISIVAYYFSDQIYIFLLRPLQEIMGDNNRKMIYTNLTEAFFTYIKLSCFTAFLISTPMFLWHIYAFIAPGLYKKERKTIVPYLISVPLLFYIGTAFAYYFVFPFAWKFFISFENLNYQIPIILEAKVSEYLGLVMHLIFAFGLSFQLPVVLSLLVKMGIISNSELKKRRKYAIIIIFIIAAIITPPDVVSQISLAIPMILLYELGILISK